MCSLQSERDGLLHKLSNTSAAATAASGAHGGGGSGGGGVGGDAKAGAALARMKARVAELEARIKENRRVLCCWFPLWYSSTSLSKFLWGIYFVLSLAGIGCMCRIRACGWPDGIMSFSGCSYMIGHTPAQSSPMKCGLRKMLGMPTC